MDAPTIKYCKTSDGVSIAYAMAGSGPPLLRTAAPGNHIQLDWEGVAAMRLAARSSCVVWYDARGGGLSERRVSDFTMDAMLRDLEAVVEAAELDRFALIAGGDAVPIAVTYAGQNKACLTHLILIHGWVEASDYQQGFPQEIVEAVTMKSPEAYLEATARLLFPESPEAARRWVAESPARIETELHIASQTAMQDWNAEPFLAEIVAPTLVVGSRTSLWLPPTVPQRIAAGIAKSQLVFEDSLERAAELIEDFIFRTSVRLPGATSRPAAGTAIILFADIADSTALTERLGDAAFREKARELDEALRRAISSNGGTAIDGKLLGDGVLATFGAASEAIACAQEIHRAARTQGPPPRVGARPRAKRRKGLGEGSALLLHVGIHAGDVIRESNNVYGGAVNIASRIASEAAAGETLVSATVRDLARTSAGVSFEDRGERALKGVSEPVRVFAVRPADGGWRQ